MLRACIPQPLSLQVPPASPSSETVAAFEELGRRSGEHLSVPQREQLQCLLRDFIDTLWAGLVQHYIDTSHTAPIRLRPHYLPLAKHQAAEELIQNMADIGIIEPSESPCSGTNSWHMVLASRARARGLTEDYIHYRLRTVAV